MPDPNDRSRWKPVKDMMGAHEVLLGQHLSNQMINFPRRLLYSTSYYKFASKLIGSGKKVLDVGCGEGLGTWLLTVECGRAHGVDIDQGAIDAGRINWKSPNVSFECADFLRAKNGKWDAVVSFDVIKHVSEENSHFFFEKVIDCLEHDGIAVIGCPNVTSDRYAREVHSAGPFNLYSWEKLDEEMKEHFSNVFMFGANDEVVHTGSLSMAHYLIAVGCKKKV